ncbi:MAG: RraA family protein [bacterium]|nr:RraA family protein [bacterium]
MLSHEDLLMLTQWNTPAVYNGWEQITRHDPARECFNLEETTCFTPHMGAMAGYAATVVIQPSDASRASEGSVLWNEYRRYLAATPGPKIVVVQDLDKPNTYGAFFGEVNSNAHKSLGCVGAIADGGVRDLDEMRRSGFVIIARRLCVGHAHAIPLRWGCEVEAFGCAIRPGQLIHADQHGFLAVPPEDEARLLEAAAFMDENERRTLIAAAKNPYGKPPEGVAEDLAQAAEAFSHHAAERYKGKGEWG